MPFLQTDRAHLTDKIRKEDISMRYIMTHFPKYSTNALTELQRVAPNAVTTRLTLTVAKTL